MTQIKPNYDFDANVRPCPKCGNWYDDAICEKHGAYVVPLAESKPHESVTFTAPVDIESSIVKSELTEQKQLLRIVVDLAPGEAVEAITQLSNARIEDAFNTGFTEGQNEVELGEHRPIESDWACVCGESHR